MGSDSLADAVKAEAGRIRREFARRDATIPRDFYAPERPANRFARQRLLTRVSELLSMHGRILDVGCGSGEWLAEFERAERYGIDLSAERIAKARKVVPGAQFDVADASAIRFDSEFFDIVSQFTVFSSVHETSMKRAMAAEMLRVLRPGGAILWYDLRIRNPWNTAIRPMGKDEIRELFVGCRIQIESRTLLPPLARAIVPRAAWLAGALEWVPLLRSHYLAMIRKQA